MSRLPIVAFILVAPCSALAKLEIKNVQPSHGLLGPPRATDDVYPMDEYFIRYQVTGIKPDNDGKADLEVSAKLVAPDGKVVFERKTPPGTRPLSLGGDTLQSS